MADRGITFSAPMVRALLDGRKSQTRRLVKPARVDPADDGGAVWASDGIALVPFLPPVAPGDRLWVREAWATGFSYDAIAPRDMSSRQKIYRLADENSARLLIGRTRPSIHMPRWASRLTLGVTEARVQRLQEISEEDAIAEGVEDGGCLECGGSSLANEGCCYRPTPSFRDSFAWLWNSLHGPDAWTANPWICAISFTVHHRNIDQMEPQP